MLIALLAVPAFDKRTVREKKLIASKQFETAQRMREALAGKPETARSKKDFPQDMDPQPNGY